MKINKYNNYNSRNSRYKKVMNELKIQNNNILEEEYSISERDKKVNKKIRSGLLTKLSFSYDNN